MVNIGLASVVYHHNLWFNLKTLERVNRVMFRPKCGQGPLPNYGLLYGFTGRKGSSIKGVAALAPNDFPFDDVVGGKVLKRYATGPKPLPEVKADDWPMFRGNLSRGNSLPIMTGKKLSKKWEAVVGLGGKSYGVMDGERTGLAQATSAYGLAVVADIDAQRIVALDQESGKEKWTFHVGSRVEFSPSLYNGLCLFGAEDGYVYALNVKTGDLIYKLQIAPVERYIGGQDKVESMWPVGGDMLIADGCGYAVAGLSAAIHGGLRIVAFIPETGELLWSKTIQEPATMSDGEFGAALLVWNDTNKSILVGTKEFNGKTGSERNASYGKNMLRGRVMEDWLSTNNRNRLSEDAGSVQLKGGLVSGRIVAFSDNFGVGFNVAREGKTVFHTGVITLSGKNADGSIKWDVDTKDFNIDDLLVTKDKVYCAGHYDKEDKLPELREISMADGSTLATHILDSIAAYNGMSAAGNKLFVATRDGKLICFECK